MGPYMRDEKMMMYYFQESLKGPAMKWYLNLDKKKMHTWSDLASAFLKQYQHNADFAPDKSSLRKLSMNKNENFRSFALRWRNQAARVEPPMTEKELVDAFIEIECLNQQFKFSCANAIDFAHLVRTGIRIEAALKVNDNDKYENTKNDDAVDQVIANSTVTAQSLYNVPNIDGHRSKNQQRQPQQHQNRAGHEPLPLSQTDLFRRCVAEGLLSPIPGRQFLPPYPSWYDANTYCEFHSGNQGHATDNCYILRDTLHRLIDAGKLKLTSLDATPANVSVASTSTGTSL
jgi:hypothetical protein